MLGYETCTLLRRKFRFVASSPIPERLSIDVYSYSLSIATEFYPGAGECMGSAEIFS
jgi:hypothetical protein